MLLFNVLLIVCSFIFCTIDGCPTVEKPCTTANGTQGSCVPSKNCAAINRLIGATSPEDLEFITSSICGYDPDKSRLFCCDISELNVVPASSAKSIAVQKVSADFQREEIASRYCQTPSDERGQCISVYDCATIYGILQNSTGEEERRYLREARCGYDNGNVLVCCGTQVNFGDSNKEDEDKLNFQYNDLIPRDACGVEVESPENQMQLTASRLNTNVTLKTRIFGGTDTGINELPWVVLLESTSRRTSLCGGAIVSSRYVLTAAHCISGDRAEAIASVRLGGWNLKNDGQDCVSTGNGSYCVEPAINVGIESLHPHPDYDDAIRGRYHDIGLIRLQRDVQFTNNIRPICLPDVNDYVPPGERLTLSGWGLKNFSTENSIKQKVELPVIPKSQCSVMFEVNSVHNKIGKGQFCAGGEAGLDACAERQNIIVTHSINNDASGTIIETSSGDSGGPLMRRSSSTPEGPPRWYLEGIVSLGFGCGVENYYGVYTKVSNYIGWIHRTVKR